ncbi:MAG: hypothetical protein J4428_02975 [Candidatus Aenigmarchaeota archaeon]|nr:hypothetical protein [Candidatus Aenigmarchaeota archaeon]
MGNFVEDLKEVLDEMGYELLLEYTHEGKPHYLTSIPDSVDYGTVYEVLVPTLTDLGYNVSSYPTQLYTVAGILTLPFIKEEVIDKYPGYGFSLASKLFTVKYKGETENKEQQDPA